jgi:hypothetical protein
MWHHHAYQGGYSYHTYHQAHGSWLVHTIIGAVIHGLIYGAIFRVMRNMSIEQAIIVAVVGVAVVGGAYWWWGSRR